MDLKTKQPDIARCGKSVSGRKDCKSKSSEAGMTCVCFRVTKYSLARAKGMCGR